MAAYRPCSSQHNPKLSKSSSSFLRRLFYAANHTTLGEISSTESMQLDFPSTRQSISIAFTYCTLLSFIFLKNKLNFQDILEANFFRWTYFLLSFQRSPFTLSFQF